MSTRTDDTVDQPTSGDDEVDFERYADLRLGEGAVIIYDRTGVDAWVQSESAVDRGRMV